VKTVRDWKAIAEAAGLEISGPELERVAAPLQALEETLGPLFRELPHDLEPPLVFRADEEDA
jgi:hypothetical protein